MNKCILSWYLELSVCNLLSYFQFIRFLKFFLLQKRFISFTLLSSSIAVVPANKTALTELSTFIDKSRVRWTVIMLVRPSSTCIWAIISSPIIVGECVHICSTTKIDRLFVPVELRDEGASAMYLVFDEQLYLLRFSQLFQLSLLLLFERSNSFSLFLLCFLNFFLERSNSFSLFLLCFLILLLEYLKSLN